MENLDLIGELVDEDFADDPYAYLGQERVLARRGARMRTFRSPSKRVARLAEVAREVSDPLPGVGRLQPAVWPLGFPTIQFTNTSATALQSQTSPQRPFKGSRVIIALARTANATQLVTMNNLRVGTNSQLISTDPVAVAAFAADAFHTVLQLQQAKPGVNVTFDFGVSANPGTGETIDVQPTILGITVG